MVKSMFCMPVRNSSVASTGLWRCIIYQAVPPAAAAIRRMIRAADENILILTDLKTITYGRMGPEPRLSGIPPHQNHRCDGDDHDDGGYDADVQHGVGTAVA